MAEVHETMTPATAPQIRARLMAQVEPPILFLPMFNPSALKLKMCNRAQSPTHKFFR